MITARFRRTEQQIKEILERRIARSGASAATIEISGTSTDSTEISISASINGTTSQGDAWSGSLEHEQIKAMVLDSLVEDGYEQSKLIFEDVSGDLVPGTKTVLPRTDADYLLEPEYFGTPVYKYRNVSMTFSHPIDI